MLSTLLPLGSLLLAAAPTAQPQQAELIVYSSRHYDSDQKLYEAFESETGIRIKLTEDSGDSLLARLKDPNAPGDVLMTVDAGRLWAADEAGLFQPTRSAVLEERIPENLRHQEGHWFGLSMRARCIFYNRERVSPSELTDYESLADPKWKGRVLIRSSSNVYNQSLVGSVIARRGKETAEAWVKGLVANFARKPQGGDTDQLRALAAGEGDVAVANSYYYARLMKSDDPKDKEVVQRVGIFFPNQKGRGTHVNVGGAGVLKASKNVDAAKRFLEFLASDRAQTIFSSGNNEFPVVPGVACDAALKPWTEYRFDQKTSVAEFGSLTGEALRMMDRAGWR
ncbi:MAG: Fe(3+) ABC transporter substrate-binding protein [Planctomycetota bacterium]